MTYHDYIQTLSGDLTGKCGIVTAAMQAQFPELERVRGHFVDHQRSYPHWWLVTPDGDIVDPTADQFPLPGEYREHVGEEPTGKCYQCGAYTFKHQDFCGDLCRDAYTGYLMSGGVL